jgi:hypothetical protein
MALFDSTLDAQQHVARRSKHDEGNEEKTETESDRLPDDARKVLVEAIGKAAQDPEYHAVLRNNSLSPAYLALDDYKKYIQSVYDQYGEIWKRSPWVKD